MMGVDPYLFVDQRDEDYLIKVAMLRKARELHVEEVEAQAKLIGREVAEVIAKMF